MIDFIVFSVGSSRYALKIENIHRIIQATKITEIPNSNSLIDGMLSYEGQVIKVLSFRKLIGLKTYDEELRKKFLSLKEAHNVWVEDLKNSVKNGISFARTTDPHKCDLGIWLDNFNSYDERVSSILKSLISNHKSLHLSAVEVLEKAKVDKIAAIELLETKVYQFFSATIGAIDAFLTQIESVSNSLQKFLIYENGAQIFAIKIDEIEDIAHVDLSTIMHSDENSSNAFLELDGILDLNSTLINVIKKIDIPGQRK